MNLAEYCWMQCYNFCMTNISANQTLFNWRYISLGLLRFESGSYRRFSLFSTFSYTNKAPKDWSRARMHKMRVHPFNGLDKN